MKNKERGEEIITIILTSLVLALAVAFKDTGIFYTALISFFIIITLNVLIKKAVGYYFETDVRTKFWTWYQYGLRKDWHFKKPIPMIWLPLLIVLLTRGFALWLGILEFDVEAKTERVSRRHGLYRFTEVTELHIAWIAVWALIANLILAITAYVVGYELLAKLSIYFIAWSTIPIGRLDGSKIFYGDRTLWIITFAIAMIALGWGLTII